MVSLEVLYPALLRHALRYAGYEDAEDAVQNTLLRAKPRNGAEASKAYYHQVMRTVLVDAARYRKRHRTEQLFDTVPERDFDFETHALVLETLDRLAGIRHGDLLLDFARGWSMRELAEREGVSLGTIKTRLHRARLALGPRPVC